jgi:hypothetical protein
MIDPQHMVEEKMKKKYKVTGWSIVTTVERPDGTWFDHTITDFPEHIGITINEWLEDYKTTEEENLD